MDLIITKLNTDETGGVIEALWKYEYLDGGFESIYLSSSTFTPNKDDAQYVEYSELTESIVGEWITNAIGDERISEIQNYLMQRVEKHKKLSKGTASLPWS